MRLAIPGIIEPVAPVLQPGVATPVVQGAACDDGVAASGVAASCRSGAATQPPSAANNGTMTATARGKPEDRSVTGMQLGPFGIGAGAALMLPGTVGASDAATPPVFGAG